MNELMWIFMAILAGCFMPTQAGINALMQVQVKSPFIAAFISFFIGTLCLLAYCLLGRVDWPGTKVLYFLPWWMWTGGAMGAMIVTTSIVVGPRIGAVNMLTFFLVGQIVASLIFDHFGWLGFPVHPVNIWRVLGLILLALGVFLIRKF